jgi:large subunit ribosomal protein L24e
MAVCNFCGNNFVHKGKMYVLKSGKILYFCSSKCEKNHLLGRKGRNTTWTKTAHDIKKK